MTRIGDGLKATAYSLLVLFFVYGLIRESMSLRELKRPETGIRLLLRFVISKSVITYGSDILDVMGRIGGGLIREVLLAGNGPSGGELRIPDEILYPTEAPGIMEGLPLFIISLIGCLIILVLSYVLLFTVYGRFFRIFILTAIAPVPLSAFASAETERTGRQFLKLYASTVLEGVLIALACILYSYLAASMPEISADISGNARIWLYLGELIFNMMILVGIVKGSDRLVREITG